MQVTPNPPATWLHGELSSTPPGKLPLHSIRSSRRAHARLLHSRRKGARLRHPRQRTLRRRHRARRHQRDRNLRPARRRRRQSLRPRHITNPSLDLSAVGLYVDGTFHNAANPDARTRGLAGALPYGAFAAPLHHSPWVFAAAATPEILHARQLALQRHPRHRRRHLRLPNPGNPDHRHPLFALARPRPLEPGGRPASPSASSTTKTTCTPPTSSSSSRSFKASKSSSPSPPAATAGTARPASSSGPTSRIHTALAWKSGTTLRTQGDANGSASALFTALGISSDPTYHYHALGRKPSPPGLRRRRLLPNLPPPHPRPPDRFHRLGAGLPAAPRHPHRRQQRHHQLRRRQHHGAGCCPPPLEQPGRHPPRRGDPRQGKLGTPRRLLSRLQIPFPRLPSPRLTAAIMQNAIGAGAGYSHGPLQARRRLPGPAPLHRIRHHTAPSRRASTTTAGVRVATQSLTLHLSPALLNPNVKQPGALPRSL